MNPNGKPLLPTIDNGIDPLDHDGLVIKWALVHGARRPVKDSVQYADGWIGLIRACELFDQAYGVKFSTYASWWIRQKITRPVGSKFYRDESGKRLRLNVVAMSQMTAPNEDWSPFSDLAVEPTTTIEVVERNDEGRDHRDLVERCLRLLDPRSRLVIARRFLDGKTLDEVGAEINVSRERVRQIEAKAMDRITRAIDHSPFLNKQRNETKRNNKPWVSSRVRRPSAGSAPCPTGSPSPTTT